MYDCRLESDLIIYLFFYPFKSLDLTHILKDLVVTDLPTLCKNPRSTVDFPPTFTCCCRVKSAGIPMDDNVTFSYSINITKIVKPPLPVGYWGNCCVPVFVHLAASDLVDRPIWETAGRIRNSKIHITDEYVRSFIDFHELHTIMDNGGRAPAAEPTHVSGFTDWRHLGHSKLDFGWGGPVSVVPLSRNILGSDEPCFFLPYSAAGKGERNGFKVLVNLPESSVAGFREEMEKFFNQYRVSY